MRWHIYHEASSLNSRRQNNKELSFYFDLNVQYSRVHMCSVLELCWFWINVLKLLKKKKENSWARFFRVTWKPLVLIGLAWQECLSSRDTKHTRIRKTLTKAPDLCHLRHSRCILFSSMFSSVGPMQRLLCNKLIPFQRPSCLAEWREFNRLQNLSSHCCSISLSHSYDSTAGLLLQ